MAGKFNVSLEVVNWYEAMEDTYREAQKIASNDIVGRVRFATSTLRNVTPVDTGRARASWKNRIVLSRRGELKDAEITSDVDYMVYLNNGHSQQAPAYFIEEVLMTIGVLTE